MFSEERQNDFEHDEESPPTRVTVSVVLESLAGHHLMVRNRSSPGAVAGKQEDDEQKPHDDGGCRSVDTALHDGRRLEFVIVETGTSRLVPANETSVSSRLGTLVSRV